MKETTLSSANIKVQYLSFLVLLSEHAVDPLPHHILADLWKRNGRAFRRSTLSREKHIGSA